MGKFIRHGIGALVGAMLGALVAAMAGQGIEVNPDQVNEVGTHLTNALTLFVTLFGYAGVEKFLKRFPSIDLQGYIDRTWLKREAEESKVRRL